MTSKFSQHQQDIQSNSVYALNNSTQYIQLQQNNHSFLRMSAFQIDFISGYTAAVISYLVSHPLDTIKVRMQIHQNQKSKLFQMIHNILLKEGVRGFFKGALSPLVGRAPISTMMYTGNGYAQRQLSNYPDLNINLKSFMSGLFAGICYLNGAFVFDLMKTKAQKSQDKTLLYRNEIQRIYKCEGLYGFTRGYSGLALRDCIGLAIFFGLFDYFKRISRVSEKDLNENKSMSDHLKIASKKFLCGGFAGIFSWSIVYPFDTVKTIMQSNDRRTRLSVYQVFTDIHKKHGISSLYKGMHVQMMRAFPSSATSLLVFDSLKIFLNNKNQ